MARIGVVEICERTTPFRILPRIEDIVSGQVGLKDLRDVRIEDLLGRDPVNLDWQTITEGIQDKVIFITGGGGSIGSELCRQIARLMPRKLVVLERSEFNLFAIERELRKDFPDLALDMALVDVCDSVCVEKMLKRHVPDIIFCCGPKHVPMLKHRQEPPRSTMFLVRL